MAYDLNLIDPDNEYGSATAYPFPKAAPASPNIGAETMYASMGLSAISAITHAFSQSSAIKAQGDYEQTISNTNAKIANLQAKEAEQAGDLAAAKENSKTQQTVSAVRAAQGASGVDVSSGSSALVREAIQGAGVQDELTLRNNAARQAWGYKTEAIQDTFRGQFARLTSRAQSEQSLLSGGLSAISGPLAIESNYLRFSRYMGGGSGSNTQPFPLVTG